MGDRTYNPTGRSRTVSPRPTRRASARCGPAAATIAACTPVASPGWTLGPTAAPAASGAPGPTLVPTPVPSGGATPPPTNSPAPSANIPPGWTSHDIDARQVIRRYLGSLAPAHVDAIFKAITA
jgi:hypothetical protein